MKYCEELPLLDIDLLRLQQSGYDRVPFSVEGHFHQHMENSVGSCFFRLEDENAGASHSPLNTILSKIAVHHVDSPVLQTSFKVQAS